MAAKNIAQSIIITLFEGKNSIERTEESLDRLIGEYVPPQGILGLTESEKREIKNEIYSQFYRDILSNKTEIKISEGITLVDSKGHVEWDISKIHSYYWSHLNSYLSKSLLLKHGDLKAAAIIQSLDTETNKILNCIEDPRRDEFANKGLVVGFVQSGKTQNFTGLIAKAADAGYKLIVIMAGIYNSLRQQTQIRIDKELTGFNTLNLDEEFVEWTDNTKRWVPLTSAGSKYDNTSGEFGVYHESFNDRFRHNTPPVIAVIKKNKTVLNRFYSWIDDGVSDVLDKTSLLMIDDEADQASIDTTKDEETNPSAINAGIRNILSKFKKHAYVGYTATPFANVLIGRDMAHPELESDLYPRNFIHTLPKPDGYFGTYTLFAEDFSNFFYQKVGEEEKGIIIRDSDLPNELDNSLIVFLLSIAIRFFRGQYNEPMSMLIHVDHRKIGHKKCLDVVQGRIDDLKTLLKIKTSRRIKLITHINNLYEKLVTDAAEIRKNLNLVYDVPAFDFVIDKLPSILEDVKIYKLNSDSKDELDYVKNPSLKVIAIGGNQLSRGLTLEGLVTTYFMRDSKQYDTLLQMGRWFGYRQGFEDLVRIFTPLVIRDSFTHLAEVERELRDNLSVYEKEGVTPAEIAPIIRDHTRLNVTSRNKMGAGEKIRYYGKTIEQTIWFPLDDIDKLRENVDSAESLLFEANKYSVIEPVNGSYLLKKVDASIIIEFFKKYRKPERENIGNKGIDISDILRYLNRHKLEKWNICVASSTRTDIEIPQVKFGPVERVKPFIRSRKILKGSGAYNLGVLSSKNHFKIDLEKNAKDSFSGREFPLLVFYKIYRHSKSENSSSREDLFAGLQKPDFDPIGFAIVFPASKIEKDEYDYIGQIFER